MDQVRHFACVLAWFVFAAFAAASPYRGVVTFGGLPLPGATVTATLGTKTVTAVTDESGAYSFDDLPDGTWTIEVDMQLFASVHADVTCSVEHACGRAGIWKLTLLPPDQITAQAAGRRTTARSRTAARAKCRLVTGGTSPKTGAKAAQAGAARRCSGRNSQGP